MGKSFLSESDVKSIKDRYEATVKIGNEQGMNFVPFSQDLQFNPLNLMSAISTERLEKSAKTLNCLTIVLIIITAFLAILTGMSAWKLYI
jgi:hypothetical protein